VDVARLESDSIEKHILKSAPLPKTTNAPIQETSEQANPHKFLPMSEAEDLAFFRAACIEARLTFVSDDVGDLYDVSTPLGKAFDWILNADQRVLHPDADNLVQRFVLAVLYYATAGEHWYSDLRWMTEKHECEWRGSVKGKSRGVVQCDGNMRVTKIDLVDNNLRGMIPAEIGWLPQLDTFDLQWNALSGTIPTFLGFLNKLQYLYLNNNAFTGQIPPELGQLTAIKKLHFEGNDLTGTMPSTICNLTEHYNLTSLRDDCAEKSFISCRCCTECCDGLGFCLPLEDGFVTDEALYQLQLQQFGT